MKHPTPDLPEPDPVSKARYEREIADMRADLEREQKILDLDRTAIVAGQVRDHLNCVLDDLADNEDPDRITGDRTLRTLMPYLRDLLNDHLDACGVGNPTHRNPADAVRAAWDQVRESIEYNRDRAKDAS